MDHGEPGDEFERLTGMVTLGLVGVMPRSTKLFSRLLAVVAFALVFSVVEPAMAAYRYVVTISDLGESNAKSYKFTNKQPKGSGAGTTRRRGGSSLSDLTIVKGVDKSTPLLLESQVKGKVHGGATLQLYNGSKLVFTIKLKNVRVTSVSHSTPKGNPQEEFSLNYEEITWTFHGGGKGKSGKVETKWNVEKGK